MCAAAAVGRRCVEAKGVVEGGGGEAGRLVDRSVQGVAGGDRLEVLSLRRRRGAVATRRRTSSMVMESMPCLWRGCRRSGDNAGDVAEDGGVRETSWWATADQGSPGLWRRGPRGPSKPNAPPLLKQGSLAGGVADGAVERLGRGVRHVVAER